MTRIPEGLFMKKIVFISLIIIAGSTSASGYISGIAIQTDNSAHMQVFVNGKLYNKQPGKFVRIKSLPGLYHIQIKVLNPFDKTWYIIRKDIRVEKGYEAYFRISFEKSNRPSIQLVKQYPVYSRYFLNPAMYNRHPVT